MMAHPSMPNDLEISSTALLPVSIMAPTTSTHLCPTPEVNDAQTLLEYLRNEEHETSGGAGDSSGRGAAAGITALRNEEHETCGGAGGSIGGRVAGTGTMWLGQRIRYEFVGYHGNTEGIC
jgi:hypothetical protein